MVSLEELLLFKKKIHLLKIFGQVIPNDVQMQKYLDHKKVY